MAVRWCSYRFVMLVLFACYVDAQPNWRFPPTNNPQPQVKSRQPQWPEPQWPQQRTPQKPQQRTPQGPESQGPQLQNTQWSKLQNPQWPQLQTPQGPQLQIPQRPEPQGPQLQTPQRPEPQGPQPHGPQLQTPQWPQLHTPQWPQLQTPQRPEPQGPQPHGPQLQTPQRPEPQGPQLQTPQRPETQGPQLQTPQRTETQGPQLQTPQGPQLLTPQRPEPQGPQQQTPQGPEPQWPQPQGPQLQNPQWPQLHTPQAPQLQTPQAPQLQTPQGPQLQTPQGPQLQTPQEPQLQTPQSPAPQLQTPQGPQLQTLQWPEPQGPQLQTPQGPEPQGPQLQTPQGPEPQGPQLQTPQRPEPQGPHKKTPQWPAVTKTQNQRCQVESKDTVQCGTPKITLAQCEAIDCCFNGQQCYYGKAVTVQCTMDAQFVVVVARNATWPKIDIDTIILLGGNNGPCSPVGITSAFAIYQFPVTACGTTLKEENGYMVYENRMASFYEVGVVPQGAITRDSQFELLFQCKYSDTAVKALVIEVNTVPAPAPVAVMGPLRVELRLAKGTCDTKTCKDESSAFTSFYTEEDYPLTKVLRQPVYVEVRILEKKDPNLVLLLEHCWTTSDPSPVSMPKWDLLIEKCSYQNDKYQTTMVPVDLSSGLLYPSHYKRFILKMFTFVDHTLAPRKDTIFIHCSASLCYPTPWDSCEPKCNKQRRDVATVVWRKTRQTAVVSSGEVVLVDKKPA
ncbi:zona pellucida sperm-binding protein 4 [Salmo salar]|uniref:Zona pellucida sperm-binding protein 4 n=1 Tax=Salmo salar TaxID=8030 RepID=A0A1S3LZX9_SALSA|nr:zona pellucida sperm-binding protein 4 [Salmo salar]